jgi:hypothetical protein
LVGLLALVGVALFTPVEERLSAVSDRILDKLPGIGGEDGESVRVTAEPWVAPCQQDWGLTSGSGAAAGEAYWDLAQDAALPELHAWLNERDAVALDTATVDIFAAGSPEEGATLKDIQILVRDRRDAKPLERMQHPPCGGEAYYSFSVPLDELPVDQPMSIRDIQKRWPEEVLSDELFPPDELPSIDRVRKLRLPLELTAKHNQELRAQVVAERFYCEWEIRLVWTVPGSDSQTTTVDFGGEPFRTAPSSFADTPEPVS